VRSLCFPGFRPDLHFDIQMGMIYNGSLQIQDALQRATLDSKSQVGSIFQVLNTKESPPTYFQTNKFTSAFQEIVDAYGYVF
jgi:hypothetical protein